jgi:NagD protein
MGRREEVECWLTDMDGVLVHENHALPGAAELLQQWEDAGTPYLVLTNNSIFTARDLSARLRSSGLFVPEDRIWTSALATADFLKQQLPGGTAFVIGEAGSSRRCTRPAS